MSHLSCANESLSLLNLHKFLTTSLKTKRRKLIIVDSRKYTLKFNSLEENFVHLVSPHSLSSLFWKANMTIQEEEEM
jgi:hypothetical protein